MIDHQSAHEDAEDRFYAQFDSREVELMTLDALQEAFEAGKIHGNTFVCREGEDEWLTLAEVAGLGEEEEEEESALVAPPVSGTRPPMPTRRPEESRPPMPERRPEGGSRPPMPERRPEGAQTRPPMPNRSADVQGGGESRPPMPERRPPMNTEPAARFQPSLQPVAVVAAAKPLTFAPVTSNFDYAGVDLDETALRPKRRWGVVLAAAAGLALVGGGAVFALNARALDSSASSTAALQAAASKSQATLTPSNIQSQPSEPAAAAPSTPEPAAAPASSGEAAKAAPELSDEMKQALLAADKTHQTKHAAKVKAHAAAAPRRAKAASSGGFKSGGSAYDPLNGKL